MRSGRSAKRGIIISCSATNVATRSSCRPISGRRCEAFPTLSRGSFARLAVSAAPPAKWNASKVDYTTESSSRGREAFSYVGPLASLANAFDFLVNFRILRPYLCIAWTIGSAGRYGPIDLPSAGPARAVAGRPNSCRASGRSIVADRRARTVWGTGRVGAGCARSGRIKRFSGIARATGIVPGIVEPTGICRTGRNTANAGRACSCRASVWRSCRARSSARSCRCSACSPATATARLGKSPLICYHEQSHCSYCCKTSSHGRSS
jgi:hypothetical protein